MERLLCFCGGDVSDGAKKGEGVNATGPREPPNVVIPNALLADRRCLHRRKAISLRGPAVQRFPFDVAHRFPWTDLVDALLGKRLFSIAEKDFGFEDLRATVAPVGPRKRPNG